MIDFSAVYCNANSFRISPKRIGKILTPAIFLAATLAALGQDSLVKVSCGKNTFNGAGTDACSVYLNAYTTSKYYVTLKSNNPAVSVPSGVTVRAGAKSTGFRTTVNAVSTAETATITAAANGVQQIFNITLSPATGTQALSVSATTISFGSVVVNSSAAQAVTLTSTGTEAVTVNSAAVSGTGFSVSGASVPATLSPGQSMTLQVQFDPGTVGTFSGDLTVGSTASNSTVPLSGTGAPHQVELSWIAPNSSSDPVVGYNVYRAPSGSTSYQQLNSAVDTATGYTDTAVQAGVTYDYVVKSVDASGVESAPSNMTSVVVP